MVTKKSEKNEERVRSVTSSKALTTHHLKVSSTPMSFGTFPSHTPAADATSEVRSDARSSRRILVADADDRLLSQLKSAILAAGHSVETVSTARALIEAVRRMPTHLIAMSVDLPDMTAAGIIEKVHAVCSSPPIVLIAQRGNDPRHGPLIKSAAACLFKPVESARFVGICERVLRLADQRLREGDWRSEPRRSLHAEVTVDTGEATKLEATLVNLSVRGFRIALPEAVGMGRSVKVGVTFPSSPRVITFEGRILWETPLSHGTLAGGDLVSCGTEDERILAALLQPMT
jgi:DNA-binding response OmpR family regulator